MTMTSIRHFDLVIFDDVAPSDFSPFRTAEYVHYLKHFNAALFSLEGWHGTIENRSFDEIVSDSSAFAPFRDRLLTRSSLGSFSGRLGYVTFANNAYRLLDLFESMKLPFILQLYPGGGFQLDVQESDDRLRLVLQSPMLRGVIASQNVTKKYLIEKFGFDEARIVSVYGGVYNSNVDFDFYRDKHFFGGFKNNLQNNSKNTIDLCFVAHRYLNDLTSKGFDKFVEIARSLAARFNHVRFHVVGDYSPDDMDIGEFVERWTFYGRQPTDFFNRFYRNMDVIISVNKPFALAPGAFDGFPTGACLEAGFHGVLNCINDPLNMNVELTDRQDFLLLDEDINNSIAAISALISSPEQLYAMAECGWRAFRRVFDIDQQLWARCRLISQTLLQQDSLVVSPRLSWNALRNLQSAQEARSNFLNNQVFRALAELDVANQDLRERDAHIASLTQYLSELQNGAGLLQATIDNLVNAAEEANRLMQAKDHYIQQLHDRLSSGPVAAP